MKAKRSRRRAERERKRAEYQKYEKEARMMKDKLCDLCGKPGDGVLTQDGKWMCWDCELSEHMDCINI